MHYHSLCIANWLSGYHLRLGLNQSAIFILLLQDVNLFFRADRALDLSDSNFGCRESQLSEREWNETHVAFPLGYS